MKTTPRAGDDSADLIRRLSELRIGSRELFMQATEQTRMAIVVVDPYAKDQPIVYVNRSFVDLTGYSREEAIGRNCRFLQGKDTDPKAVRAIRRALDAQDVAVELILNYRKDGTPFWNSLHIGPVFDDKGKLAYFYGSQWDMTSNIQERLRAEGQRRAAGELQHRMQNLFAVISAIVRISSRGENDADALSKKIVQRIEALGRAHRASIGDGGTNVPATSVGQLVQAVLEPYRNVHGREIALSGPEVKLPVRMVTPIGVALHELATNAMKYGALGHDEGDITISWTVEDDVLSLEWAEKKGVDPSESTAPAPNGANGGGTGSRIVEGVLKSLGGSIESTPSETGYIAQITVPLPAEELPADELPADGN